MCTNLKRIEFNWLSCYNHCDWSAPAAIKFVSLIKNEVISGVGHKAIDLRSLAYGYLINLWIFLFVLSIFDRISSEGKQNVCWTGCIDSIHGEEKKISKWKSFSTAKLMKDNVCCVHRTATATNSCKNHTHSPTFYHNTDETHECNWIQCTGYCLLKHFIGSNVVCCYSCT